MKTKEIDARGKACPIPVVMTKQAMDAGEGEIVTLVDNKTAVENLTRLAQSQGYAVTAQKEDDMFRMAFAKTDTHSVPTAPSAHIADASAMAGVTADATAGWALLVTSDQLGTGDAELGRVLMTMYFFTLAQSPEPPAFLLLLNGGVRLPTENEDVIAHCKTLEQKGCEILVCGTCLNTYKLAEQLAVGTVSNMYEISERMHRAAKVISL